MDCATAHCLYCFNAYVKSLGLIIGRATPARRIATTTVFTISATDTTRTATISRLPTINDVYSAHSAENIALR